MSRIRVGLISYEFNPNQEPPGSAFADLFQQLRGEETDYEFLAFSPKHSDLAGHQTILRWTDYLPGSHIFFCLALNFYLSRLVRRHHLQLLLLNGSSGGVRILLPPHCRIAYYLSSSDGSDTKKTGAWWRRRLLPLEKLCFNWARYLVTNSSHTAAELETVYRIAPIRIHRIADPAVGAYLEFFHKLSRGFRSQAAGPEAGSLRTLGVAVLLLLPLLIGWLLLQESPAPALEDTAALWQLVEQIQERRQAEQRNDQVLAAEQRELLKRLLELEPNNAAALKLLGENAFDTGFFSEAAGYYQELLQLDPEDLELKTNLAITLVFAGRTAQAEPIITAVLAREPDNFQALAYRAIISALEGHIAAARTEAAAALAAAPSDAERERFATYIGPLLASE